MKTLIIAEAGVNHNGDMQLARQLIDAAVEAGADIVKFQTFKAEKLASKFAEKAEYQKKTTDKSESQVQMLKKLELKHEDHMALMEYCKSKSIQFLSTPFDVESISLLKQLGIKTGKIPSGEITNLPYLEQMALSFDELVMSTGMADLNEVQQAIDVITGKGFPKEKLIVLHCNTEYPTPYSDVNLKAMQTMARELGVRVGYSDHTDGIEIPVAAVALGACLIEKHFTLDRNMEGPDHKASLEPADLKAMVSSIRHIEIAMGNGIKTPSPSESKNKNIARKSVVAAKDLKEGHILKEEDLTTKRPGNGISPMKIHTLVGRRLTKAVMEDELLTMEHFSS